jgi:transcriptional regulator with XRE-family HTH domain
MKIMSKEKKYSSSIMDDLFNEITPEELEKTEKRMRLASRIYDAMKAKGWRNKDFASAMGKNASEISKWLSGTHKFNTDTLFDIERVLGIGLLTLSDKPQEQVVVYTISVSQFESSNVGLSSFPKADSKYSSLIYRS